MQGEWLQLALSIIEPALTRLLLNLFVLFKVFVDFSIFFLLCKYTHYFNHLLILIGIIIKERHQKKGRWVFPLILVFIFYCLYNINIPNSHRTWNHFQSGLYHCH